MTKNKNKITKSINKPTQQQAEDAVRTLIAWAGDNPNREGLLETPKRVVNAYKEFFAGYQDDPKAILGKTFEDIDGYDDIVLFPDKLEKANEMLRKVGLPKQWTNEKHHS